MKVNRRFRRTFLVVLLTSCSSADVDDTSSPKIDEKKPEHQANSRSSVTPEVPCKVQALIKNSDGSTTLIYVDCATPTKKSPMSDEPGWGGEGYDEKIDVPPGWERPPPPGDPVP